MDPHCDFAPGELLEGTVYRVVRWLGEGRTGTVYEVEDTTVGRHYVLKTLATQAPAAGDSRSVDLAARLREEARALSVLSHPNIVEVVTAGVTTDARRSPFFVMPLLVGRSVRAILDARGALPLDTAYGIVIDLLDALAYAHRAGIVHRDVRPENVFIHRNVDGTYVTKLLDFGLARLRDDATPASVRRAGPASPYAAPEQEHGASATPANDLYAAGVMLFEMITGAPPSTVGERALPAPAVDPRIPPDLAPLLAAASAADPAARPESARAFGDALRALLKSHLVGARKGSSRRPRAASRAAPARVSLVSQLDAGDTEVDTGSAPPPRGFPAHGVLAAGAVAVLLTLGVVAQTWRAHPAAPKTETKITATSPTEVSHSALAAPLEPLPLADAAIPAVLAPLKERDAGAPPTSPHGPVRAPKHRPRR